MTDNGSEFRAEPFNQTLSQVGAKHIYIRLAGRRATASPNAST